MQKSLEEFAKDNRPAFDTKKIDASVWNRVVKDMKPNKRGILSSLHNKWATAAAVIIFVAGSIFYFSQRNILKVDGADSIVSKEFPGYDNAIRSFSSQISNKKAMLQAIQKEYPEVYDQFNMHITGLSLKYEELKKELVTSPNRNFLLMEMIGNLELQVRLLNQQLELIKQLERSINKENADKIKNI